MFTRVPAPHQGLTAGGVTQLVAAAACRAGLGIIYAHRLRHSTATAIPAEGGSPAEIGQVLRHRRALDGQPAHHRRLRDTIRLLLSFAAARTGTSPCRLDITDLDAPVISAFLDHLERDRGNTIRSRNARLAAIHSLFAFAALRHPEHAADIERVLAIPPKRASQTIVTFLTDEASKNVTPHALRHTGDAVAARRGRHHRHRLVAWPLFRSPIAVADCLFSN